MLHRNNDCYKVVIMLTDRKLMLTDSLPVVDDGLGVASVFIGNGGQWYTRSTTGSGALAMVIVYRS